MQNIPFSAEKSLANFMTIDGPNRTLFFRELRGQSFPGTEVYTEMANILWQRGQFGDALRLEQLWQEFTNLPDSRLPMQ